LLKKVAIKKIVPYFWTDSVQKNKTMQTTLGKYIRAKRKKLGFPLN
jgi:hypothetical protein